MTANYIRMTPLTKSHYDYFVKILGVFVTVSVSVPCIVIKQFTLNYHYDKLSFNKRLQLPVSCLYLMSIFLKSVKSQCSPFSTVEKKKKNQVLTQFIFTMVSTPFETVTFKVNMRLKLRCFLLSYSDAF